MIEVTLISKKYPRKIKILLAVYVIGFFVGVITHSIDMINGGFLPYTHAALWKNIYWTLLLPFDFLVIVLILTAVVPGLIVSNLIIISDVIINTRGCVFFGNYKIIMQTVFGLYVITTTPIIFLYMFKKVR
jgi:hypothetical protein